MDDIIIKYLQGETSEDEKKQLLKWLQQDEEHKKKFSEVRDIWLESGKNTRFSHVYKDKAFKKIHKKV